MIQLKSVIRSKCWHFLKTTWKLRSGLTIAIENDSDWFVFNEIFTNKEYSRAIDLLLDSGSNAPLVLDLGANVGYFALYTADELIAAGRRSFSIVSVEADKYNFRVLEKRTAQLQHNGRIKCFYGLAGKRSGSGNMSHSEQHYGHYITEEKAPASSPVDYLDLESLVAADRQVALLKCDIEGSEELFLKNYGSLLQRTQNAVFEWHANECNIDNCKSILAVNGLFSIAVMKEDKRYNTSVEIFTRQANP